MSFYKFLRVFTGGHMKKNKRRHGSTLNEKGMTLIEIMIVLAILAGLGGIIVNRVTSSLKKARVKNAQILITETGQKSRYILHRLWKIPLRSRWSHQ